MKQGRTLVELAQEVERQAQLKHDFKIKTSALTLFNGTDIGFETSQGPTLFEVTEHTHNQIGTRLGIPAKFYDQLRESYPDMLDFNVNELFRRKPETRMIRTLEGKARAFLSDRYARRDNFDLMKYVLPDLLEAGTSIGLGLASCEITERKLYLKFVTPKLEGEVRVGDPVRAGGIISNSEIGEGYVTAYPFVERLVCENGMVLEEYGQRKAHVGKRITADEDAMEIFSDETIQADDHAFWLKVRDSIRTVLKPEMFQKLLSKLKDSTSIKIDGNPENVVEELSNRYVLGNEERGAVLRNLIEGGIGYTKWGLANAVTALAGETANYDRATELEKLGGTIINLDPKSWISLAAA